MYYYIEYRCADQMWAPMVPMAHGFAVRTYDIVIVDSIVIILTGTLYARATCNGVSTPATCMCCMH